jgi:hypothetical protein
VIVGREYYEPEGIAPELPVEAALALILQRKLPRARSPGTVLPSSQFPAAYFSIGGVEQWFGAEFVAILDDMSGGRLRESGEEPDYWRFNRIHGATRATRSRKWGSDELACVRCPALAVWAARLPKPSASLGPAALCGRQVPHAGRDPTTPYPPPDYGPMRREDPNSLSVALGLLRPLT